MLVIGGGPAGTEFAGQMAERGHRVQLWEREQCAGWPAGGGCAAADERQLRQVDPLAGGAPRSGPASTCISDREATADDVVGAGADVVAVATGAVAAPRRRAGVELPFVLSATRRRDGSGRVGRRVVVISEDDRLAPLAIADHLAADGREVTRRVPDARPVAARRQVHDRRRHGPPRRARRDDGPDDAPRGDRARHADAGPLLQRPALDDRRRGLGRAGLRSDPGRRPLPRGPCRSTRRSTCSATPSPPAAWSSPPARPTNWPARSIDSHPSV